jgi:hypothetical protein
MKRPVAAGTLGAVWKDCRKCLPRRAIPYQAGGCLGNRWTRVCGGGPPLAVVLGRHHRRGEHALARRRPGARGRVCDHPSDYSAGSGRGGLAMARATGSGRGGFYTYERLEQMVGAGIRSADQIVPGCSRSRWATRSHSRGWADRRWRFWTPARWCSPRRWTCGPAGRSRPSRPPGGRWIGPVWPLAVTR